MSKVYDSIQMFCIIHHTNVEHNYERNLFTLVQVLLRAQMHIAKIWPTIITENTLCPHVIHFLLPQPWPPRVLLYYYLNPSF